jgi:hypothetical protein
MAVFKTLGQAFNNRLPGLSSDLRNPNPGVDDETVREAIC